MKAACPCDTSLRLQWATCLSYILYRLLSLIPGSSTETPLAREGYPSDNGSGDRGGGGSGGPSLAESLKAAASDRDDPWAHLPLHHKSGSGSTPPNGLLSRHPLVPAMLETCAGYLAGDLWMTQCVRTESVYTLPSVKVSLATHTAFGALHTDGSTSSFHRDSPGITAADMAEETGWSTFVKDEISHIRSRVSSASFYLQYSVLPVCLSVCLSFCLHCYHPYRPYCCWWWGGGACAGGVLTLFLLTSSYHTTIPHPFTKTLFILFIYLFIFRVGASSAIVYSCVLGDDGNF